MFLFPLGADRPIKEKKLMNIFQVPLPRTLFQIQISYQTIINNSWFRMESSQSKYRSILPPAIENIVINKRFESVMDGIHL